MRRQSSLSLAVHLGIPACASAFCSIEWAVHSPHSSCVESRSSSCCVSPRALHGQSPCARLGPSTHSAHSDAWRHADTYVKMLPSVELGSQDKSGRIEIMAFAQSLLCWSPTTVLARSTTCKGAPCYYPHSCDEAHEGPCIKHFGLHGTCLTWRGKATRMNVPTEGLTTRVFNGIAGCSPPNLKRGKRSILRRGLAKPSSQPCARSFVLHKSCGLLVTLDHVVHDASVGRRKGYIAQPLRLTPDYEWLIASIFLVWP
eukprot:4407003-Amphidinium_carterae.1